MFFKNAYANAQPHSDSEVLASQRLAKVFILSKIFLRSRYSGLMHNSEKSHKGNYTILLRLALFQQNVHTHARLRGWQLRWSKKECRSRENERRVMASPLVFASFAPSRWPTTLASLKLNATMTVNFPGVRFHDTTSCSKFCSFQEGFGHDERIWKPEKLYRHRIINGIKNKTRDHPFVFSTGSSTFCSLKTEINHHRVK